MVAWTTTIRSTFELDPESLQVDVKFQVALATSILRDSLFTGRSCCAMVFDVQKQ